MVVSGVPPSTIFLDDFCFETTELILVKFHMHRPGKGGKKLYIVSLGRIIKMTYMPIYGLIFQKSSFSDPLGRLP